MKHFFETLFSDLGLNWKYLLNGIIGATVWSIHKKSKFIDALRQIFIGGIVSGYATSYLSNRVDTNALGFLSFTVGMVGMVLIDAIYGWMVKKIKLLF